MADFKDLVGKTLLEVNFSANKDMVDFVCKDGKIYKMLHRQDCCEGVSIDDIAGDIKDLIGAPIIIAEEVTNSGMGETDYDKDEGDENRIKIDGEWPDCVERPKDYAPESYTWTFYKLATNKGYVTIRWYGSSNGYYSEEVSFLEEGDYDYEG